MVDELGPLDKPKKAKDVSQPGDRQKDPRNDRVEAKEEFIIVQLKQVKKHIKMVISDEGDLDRQAILEGIEKLKKDSAQARLGAWKSTYHRFRGHDVREENEQRLDSNMYKVILLKQEMETNLGGKCKDGMKGILEDRLPMPTKKEILSVKHKFIMDELKKFSGYIENLMIDDNNLKTNLSQQVYQLRKNSTAAFKGAWSSDGSKKQENEQFLNKYIADLTRIKKVLEKNIEKKYEDDLVIAGPSKGKEKKKDQADNGLQVDIQRKVEKLALQKQVQNLERENEGLKLELLGQKEAVKRLEAGQVALQAKLNGSGEKRLLVLSEVIRSLQGGSETQINVQKVQEGARKFEELYYAVDSADWKYLLTQTEQGRDLQGLYLGRKPCVDLLDAGTDDLRIKVYEHSKKLNHFAVAIPEDSGSDSEGSEDEAKYREALIFSEDSVKGLLEKYPTFFPDYHSKEWPSIGSYLLDRGMPYTTSSGEKVWLTAQDRDVQNGLLWGYPLYDTIQYALYRDKSGMYQAALEEKIGLSTIPGINYISDTQIDSLGLNAEQMLLYKATRSSNFLAEHEKEFEKLIEEKIPEIPPDIKRFLVKSRSSDIPGLVYLVADPTSEAHLANTKDVHDRYDISGMRNFLAQVSNE